MRLLIAFIKRFRFFFVFLLLETFSIFLIISSNNYAASWYFNAGSKLSGTVGVLSNRVTDYVNLREINKNLAIQNAQLLEQIDQSSINIDTITEPIIQKDHFLFIPAKVVSNSINKRNNYIMINKGTNCSIHKNMGVIGPKGVVGVVIGVSENFAIIMSVLHKSTNISAKIIPENIIGSVFWDGFDYTKVSLSNIPEHYLIKTGEKVVTSGYSLLFPEGVDIGTIDKVERSDNPNLYDIELNLSTDFQTLKWVYVVDNILLEEQENLIETSQIDN